MMAWAELKCILLLLLTCHGAAFRSHSSGGGVRCCSRTQRVPQIILTARKPRLVDETTTIIATDTSNKNEDDPEWNFLDTARIHVQGGDGGNGCATTTNTKNSRRAKRKRKNDGEDEEEERDDVVVAGGRGGRGGSVYVVCDNTLQSLVPMRQQIHFKAEKGNNGSGKNKDGTNGADVIVKTPPGTLVRELKTQQLLVELQEAGETYLLAKGGDGASKLAESGEQGEERWLSIELRLGTDVGFVGMPNSGKSTILAMLSNAKPRIADYPFTTTNPNLGVCNFFSDDNGNDCNETQQDNTKKEGRKKLVLCDLPGLMEGAVQHSAGMGAAFLRHVELCPVLLHVVDATTEDPTQDYHIINQELLDFGDGNLAQKPQVVVLTKTDGLPKEKTDLLLQTLRQKAHHSRVLSFSSSATTENMQELMKQLYKFA